MFFTGGNVVEKYLKYHANVAFFLPGEIAGGEELIEVWPL